MDFDYDLSSISNVLVLDPGAEKLTVSGQAGLVLPVGTTGQRPTGVAGTVRFNTSNVAVDLYDGSQWVELIAGSNTLALTGDITAPATLLSTGTIATTLANSGVTAGSYGNATQAGTFTVDSKGRITTAGNVTITPAWSSITSTPTTLAGYGITNAVVANPAITAGTYTQVTVDTKGLVTAGANPTTLSGYGITDALNLNGGTMIGNIIMPTGTTITLTDGPTNPTDAANKAYVDAAAAGLSWKNSVKVATTGPITLSGTQTIDGIAVVAGDRVLVKDQASAAQNGIYVVDASQWTRATDLDQTTPINEANGAAVWVEQGSTQGNTGWTVISQVATISTSAMDWAQFNGASGITAGVGMIKVGNTLSIALGAGISELPTAEVGLDVYANGALFLTVDGTTASTLTNAQLAVKLDGSTLTRSASGLKVADGGITSTQINSSALGTGLTGGSGSAIALATSGAVAGTYNNVTVDTYGRVTVGSNVAYLTGNETITVTGDATGSGTTSIALTLANSGVTAGTYTQVTVDAKGRVTLGANPTTLAGYGITDAVLNAGGTPSIQEGTLAGRPAAGTAGRLYVCTDLHTIYRDTGSSWVEISPTSALDVYTENSSSPVASTVTGANAVSIGSGNTSGVTVGLATGAGAVTRAYGAEARASGSFSTAGDAQAGKYVLRNITTDGTETELFADGTGAQIVLPANSTWAYSIQVSARRTDGDNENAGFKLEGVIKRDGSAVSTSLVGNRNRTILTRPNANWTADVFADASSGALTVKVIGQAAKNVRWVATVITTEVTE